MSYQFEIYPSGHPSNYRVKVNSLDGVSAIIDKQMGITEYSLSGVAFYIKSISDYINQYNVGTQSLPITSGFFNHIGYTNYISTDEYPFYTSIDGIISGVYTIHSSGVYFKGSKLFIENISAVSGSIISGVLNNLTIPVYNININDKINNDEYYIASSGLLKDIIIRERIQSSNNQIGIINGVLTSDLFNLYNTTNILVNGNLYLNECKLNFDNYTESNIFDESLFNLNSHTHDGINSKQINLSSFNSLKPLTKPFNITLTSGNINIENTYNGNDIGLYSNWEIVDFPNVDNIQKLVTFKNSLYVMDEDNLVSDKGEVLSAGSFSELNSIPIIVATVNGDTPGVLTYVEETDSYLIGTNITGIHITTFNETINDLFVFDNKGANEYFNTVITRRPVMSETCTKINSKLYLSFIETFIDNPDKSVLTLYEINTINKIIKPVAHYELITDSDGWRILSPIKYKNTICYFISTASGTKRCIIYNVVYKYQKNTPVKLLYNAYDNNESIILYNTFEYNTDNRYGFNVFGTNDDFNLTTGLYKVYFNTTKTNRSYSSYTYYMNKLNCISDIGYVGFNYMVLERNALSINADVGTSTSIIAYAGKIWTGSALHISKSQNGSNNTDHRLLEKIKTITNLTNPWLMSPVIHKGWLYAIAPTVDYTTWSTITETNLHEIDCYLPPGSLIVRRRASEVDLIEMMAYSI